MLQKSTSIAIFSPKINFNRHSRHIIQNFVTNNRTEEEIMNFIKLGLMTAEACEYILDVAIKKEYTEISAYALNMLGKYPAEKQKFAL